MDKLAGLKQAYFDHLQILQSQAPVDFKQTRNQHRWSQAVLAKKLGCTATYICHIETGRMKPSSNMLIKLSEIGENNGQK